MKKLVYDVFDENENVKESVKMEKMSSCRGWARIIVNRIVKMSSCRGWARITVSRVG